MTLHYVNASLLFLFLLTGNTMEPLEFNFARRSLKSNLNSTWKSQCFAALQSLLMYFISDYLPGELLMPITGAKWKDTVLLAHGGGYMWSCWLVPELQGLHFSNVLSESLGWFPLSCASLRLHTILLVFFLSCYIERSFFWHTSSTKGIFWKFYINILLGFL